MSTRLALPISISLFALFSIFFSLSKGSTSIPFDQLLFTKNQLFHAIFLELRLPRTLAAFTVGGLLAIAGMLMQLLLRNPLADPYVLGISGGAALATLLVMLTGASGVLLLSSAWAGSLMTIAIMLVLAKRHSFQAHALLLVGVALACGFSAAISFILLVCPNRQLHSMLFWLAGDLSHAHMPWLELPLLAAATLAGVIFAPALNLLGHGENEARILGIAYERYRFMLYLVSSLLTAAAVALAGCIGFIGLIIPHITRLLTGYDHARALPIAMLLGGSLLTVADTLARTIMAPAQLPVGILMALLGTPVFIFLLLNPPRHRQSVKTTQDEMQTAHFIRATKAHKITSLVASKLGITFQPKQIWCVLGANGSGKTTLLHTLAGLRHADADSILLAGRALSTYTRHAIAQQISLLPQQTTASFAQTVWDYCAAARYPYRLSRQHTVENNERIVAQALSALDLLPLSSRLITQLSGGELRRVAMAAVLVQSPQFYLLDEPLSHLDARQQRRVLQTLQLLAETQSATIVMSLHDLELAKQYCTHALLLLPEQTLAGPVAEVLTADKLSRLF